MNKENLIKPDEVDLLKILEVTAANAGLIDAKRDIIKEMSKRGMVTRSTVGSGIRRKLSISAPKSAVAAFNKVIDELSMTDENVSNILQAIRDTDLSDSDKLRIKTVIRHSEIVSSFIKSHHCLSLEEAGKNLSLPTSNSTRLKTSLQKLGVLLLSDGGKLVAPAFQFIQPDSVNALIKELKTKANECGLSDIYVCLFLLEKRDIQRFIPDFSAAKSLSEAAAMGAKSNYLINERPLELIIKQDKDTFSLAVDAWLNPQTFDLPYESSQQQVRGAF